MLFSTFIRKKKEAKTVLYVAHNEEMCEMYHKSSILWIFRYKKHICIKARTFICRHENEYVVVLVLNTFNCFGHF